jgi:hypothetical protein
LITLATAIAAANAAPPSVEDIVNTAIEEFEPLWSPPAGELRGWTVGIDAARSGASDARGRLCDDLSLLTAAHLYHFVLDAGGSPVLSRADNTLSAAIDPASWQRRAQVLSGARCDVCLSIQYDEGGGETAVRRPPDAHADDVALADAFRAALDAEPGQLESADSELVEALRQAGGAESVALCEIYLPCPPEASVVTVAVRKTCLDNARRLYAGLARFCVAKSRQPAPSTQPVPVPDTPSSPISSRLERMARSIWPEGRLPDERLEWFCRRFAQVAISNRSLVYFDVTARREQETVVLRGRTNAPLVVGGLEQALRAVGAQQLRSDVQSLPDRRRLGEQLFGVCRAPMALTYDRPGERGGLQTQLLFGEPLFLLDQADDHYLLHAGDGYWGWVRCAAVEPMTAEQFAAYRRHPRATALQDIESGRLTIPRGSSVRVLQQPEGQCVILLPDGATLSVPAAVVRIHEPDDSELAARIQAALDLLYVPYIFGGCSPLGLDCSGLTTNIYGRAAGRPARDAWQQALGGWLVAAHWHRDGIRAGDQLFFLDESGKIHHVAIALDAMHFVHSTPPCVQINSLDPQDPLYDPRRDRTFFVVKRP